MKVEDLAIPGVKKIILSPSVDFRGKFTKIFHDGIYKEAGIHFALKEQYVSVSNKDVIRGMHFQIPPRDCDKLVTVLSGSVHDVVLDLRRNSPAYLQYINLELESDNCTALLIPKGCAHGFLALEDNSTMLYNVSEIYSSESDKGVLWNSFGYEWEVKNPVISDRDRGFCALQQFQNPF